jgi:hypothetical protein
MHLKKFLHNVQNGNQQTLDLHIFFTYGAIIRLYILEPQVQFHMQNLKECREFGNP